MVRAGNSVVEHSRWVLGWQMRVFVDAALAGKGFGARIKIAAPLDDHALCLRPYSSV